MEGLYIKNSHYCILGFIIGDFSLRIWYIIEDYMKLKKEQGDIKPFLKKQWLIHRPNKIYTTLLIILSIFFGTKFIYDRINISEEGLYILFNVAVAYLIQAKWKILETKRDVVDFIQNGNGLDYGSGMAHSYFYGYLNKLLPNNGDENIGIKENIEIYEATEGVEIPAKKLFILIPLSMHFHPLLSDHLPGIIESCKSLETVHRNVAGVMRRSYKNTVYKIHVNKMEDSKESNLQKPLYCVAEGATPLHTLYQTCTGRVPACSESIRDHSEEIVIQFYKTLTRILESFPEYHDTYELVMYEGNENIAELLVPRIRRCM